MRLEDMLKNVSGITNKVINSNCWDGQFNVLEGIQVLQSKVNEIIVAINNGIIKGDKGDTPNVQVGETTTLEPNSSASVTQTGDMLNPIFNFAIPKGEKGEKGDTGKTSESINDNLIDSDHTFSSKKITNMFNSLQDVKGIKYGTDKDYLVMNGTKNGVIKDLKIKGRSLVNLSGIKGNVNSGGQLLKTAKNLFKPNTEYTQIINIKSNTLSPSNEINAVGVINESNTGVVFPQVVIQKGFTGSIIKKSTTPSDLNSVSHISSIRSYAITTSGSMEIEEIILEGDYTQNPPSYFEGIASVGNGNEIEVLSRKEDGNLFDGNFVKGSLNASNGSITPTSNGRCIEKIILLPNTEYSVRMIKGESDRRIVTFFDNSFNVISFVTASGTLTGFTFTTPSNCRYATIYVGQNINSLVEELILSKKGYEGISYKQDKKPILFKDTDGTWKPVTVLRGVDNTLCDSIENSKYNKLLDSIILDETLNYNIWKPNPNATETIIFYLADNLPIRMRGQYVPISNLITNRIGVAKEKIADFKDLDKEGIGYWDNNIKLFVSIKKSQLETQDVAGFKKLLKKWKDEGQPLKVIYEKEVYEQYEVNPLDLESFENETMILFKYGVVNDVSEFYVDSNLGSITLNNMERISNIENEVFQVKKIVLNGDYRVLAESTYPNDFKEVNKHE